MPEFGEAHRSAELAIGGRILTLEQKGALDATVEGGIRSDGTEVFVASLGMKEGRATLIVTTHKVGIGLLGAEKHIYEAWWVDVDQHGVEIPGSRSEIRGRRRLPHAGFPRSADSRLSTAWARRNQGGSVPALRGDFDFPLLYLNPPRSLTMSPMPVRPKINRA